MAGALALALKLEVPPSIVIGRLRREKLLPYSVGLRYRRKFALVEEPGLAPLGAMYSRVRWND